MVKINHYEMILYYYLAETYNQTNVFYNTYNIYMHFQSHHSWYNVILNFRNYSFAAP